MKVAAILYPSGLKRPSAGATRGDLQVEPNETLRQALWEQPAEEQKSTATREPRSVVSIDDNVEFLSLLYPI